MATNTTSTLSIEYQLFFNKVLLETAKQKIAFAQFAQKQALPKNNGNKSVRFFRYGQASADNMAVLSEGVTPGTDLDLVIENVDVTLTQYGGFYTLTDILNATDLLNGGKQAAWTLGESMAYKMDNLLRNEIAVGATDRYAAGTVNFAGLTAATPPAGTVTSVDFLDAMTNLTINRAPRIGGDYVAVVAPQVARDIMNDEGWLKVHQYSAPEGYFKGEMGKLFGIRFVEDTMPFRETVEDTYAASGAIFSSMIFGKDAFGMVELGGQSPLSPRILMTKEEATDSDPLAQRRKVGSKFYAGQSKLNPAWIINLRSKVNYV